MTITEQFYNNFGFGAAFASHAGDISAATLNISHNARSSTATMSFVLPMPPLPPEEPLMPEALPESLPVVGYTSVADVLAQMTPVSVSVSDMSGASAYGSALRFTDMSALSSLPTFAGSVQYTGAAAETLFVDVLVFSLPAGFLIVPVNGTMPTVTTTAEMDAFLASILGVSGSFTASPMFGPVALSNLSLADLNHEVSDQRGDGNSESFIGTDGYDYMFGGGGSDGFYGGEGDDFMTGQDSSHGTSFGSLGDDSIAFAPPPGDDIDYMYGGAGNDTMIGDEDTTIMNGGAGADYHDGTLGYTIVDFSTATSRVNVHLPSGTGSWGDAEGDTYIGIEEVLGSAYDDRITLNGLAGSASGGAGHDRMFGLGGEDFLFGGTGNDTLRGGDGQDDLYGGEGDDEMSAQGGGGNMDGGIGNDLMFGDDGIDVVYGGDGDDIAYGGNDSDLMFGGNDADKLYGEKGIDAIDGGAGDDRVFGGQSGDILHGGSGNDWMHGGSGGDEMNGGADTDRMFGDTGNDTLNGEGGRDILFGGSGEDTLIFGDGADDLRGGSGNDTFVFDGSPFVLAGEGEETAAAVDITRIYDFAQGEDVIDVSNAYIFDFTQLLAQASDNNFGLKISLSPDHTLFLKDMKVDDLLETDFTYMDLYLGV